MPGTDTYYKLTDARDGTFGGCQWGENVTVETSGKGPLCGPGWTHWYTHPLLAVLLSPILGRFDLAAAHLWEGRCDGVLRHDGGLKVGCTRGTTVRRVDLPVLTREQRVRFAIGCAWQVELDADWRRWAARWLSGEDRSDAAVRAVSWGKAAWAAWAAARAPGEAAQAAWAAAWAAARAALRPAAWVATWAAARATSWACAEAEEGEIDLIGLAEWAVTDSTEVPDCRRARGESHV